MSQPIEIAGETCIGTLVKQELHAVGRLSEGVLGEWLWMLLIETVMSVCQTGFNVLQRQMRESLEEIINVRVVGEMLDNTLNRDSRPLHDRLTDHDLGIGDYSLIICRGFSGHSHPQNRIAYGSRFFDTLLCQIDSPVMESLPVLA